MQRRFKFTSPGQLNISELTAAMFLIAGSLFTSNTAQADDVWNVNLGAINAGRTITAGEDYTGAATENSANSIWNSVTADGMTVLADSTGDNAAGVTMTLTAAAGSSFNIGGQNVTGDKIFSSWIKDDGNDDEFTLTISNLIVGEAYDLVVYSDWFWQGGQGLPITQSLGSGLAGTFVVNRNVGTNGIVSSLAEDTNAANVAGSHNYGRFNDLSPDSSGVLAFSMGGKNTPFNGFQLIRNTGDPGDVTPPTPDPMAWLGSPSATGDTSITMTAAAATDPGGVQYYFTNETLGDGSHDSGWQNSATYIDTGLSPNTSYSYTVMARDGNGNTTSASPSSSATTDEANNSADTVWNVNIGSQITPSDNFVGAASENTQNSTWNSVTSSSVTDQALADSEGSGVAGVTLDLESIRGLNTQNLNSGDEIFYSGFWGAGASTDIVIKGLSMEKSYDVVFYSDWWWKGDGFPVEQTLGTEITGRIYINRVIAKTNGTVAGLAEDTNPANVTTGAGNIGNWYRLEGLIPDTSGRLGFLLGDGANAPFSGFQLLDKGFSTPRAEFLSFDLGGNPAVIEGANVTVSVPFNSDVTNLAPTFTLWPGATCLPASGTAQDFTTPLDYVVTSSDPLISTTYIVTAVADPPLPEFTLDVPAVWDGRQTITVQPNITNLALLQVNNGTNFDYQWSTSGLAIIQEVNAGVLSLVHSQGSGPLVVTLTMNNGGLGVTKSVTIDVQEPATDVWTTRPPDPDEKAIDGQFYARDPNTDTGVIYYNGTQIGSPDTVFLKVYKTPDGGVETLDATYRQPLQGGSYAFSAPVDSGLVTYRVVYGTTTGGGDTDVNVVTGLLCGDVYLIEGQSNAVATDNSEARDNTTSPWIRTYGASGGGWDGARAKATNEFWEMNIGFWGMDLAQHIVTTHQVPVCFINGAVGGTRIDQHQPNPVDHTVAGSLYQIYAAHLNRVIDAKLTHGIRGVIWHQGESDCSSFGPISGFDYVAYEENFVNMANAWKQDFPNIQGHLIFQVMPRPCNIGPTGDELREVQRNIPRLYSRMSILNTLGIDGYEGCHFSAVGYANMAARMAPVIDRDFYGVVPAGPVTAPNLLSATFTSNARTAISLEFDQAVIWSSDSAVNWYVDDIGSIVESGSASGNKITLQLANAVAETARIDYLQDATWSFNESYTRLIYGANGIPALTFSDVVIAPHEDPTTFNSWASDPAQGLTVGVNDGPLDDPDFDGFSNLLEFALGGLPLEASPEIRPSLSSDASVWIYEYDRSAFSRPPVTTQIVEYGNDLSGWTPINIPLTSSGGVTVLKGSPSDRIRVIIPDLGVKGFIRLKVNN